MSTPPNVGDSFATISILVRCASAAEARERAPTTAAARRRSLAMTAAIPTGFHSVENANAIQRLQHTR